MATDAVPGASPPAGEAPKKRGRGRPRKPKQPPGPPKPRKKRPPMVKGTVQPPVSKAGTLTKEGFPEFVPTEADRRTVRALVGMGVPQKELALLIVNPTTGNPISSNTLLKYFRRELDDGHVTALSQVAQSLFRKAVGSGPQSVAAAIFWLKARAGWSERMLHDVNLNTGVLVAPAGMTPAEWVAQQEEKNKTRENPVPDA